MISKVQVLDTRNELLDTNTQLVLASRRVSQYLGKPDLIEYSSGNSNTRYVFSLQWTIRGLLHLYGPSWIHTLGISNISIKNYLITNTQLFVFVNQGVI